MDMDLIYSAIDSYNNAIHYSKEKDIEQEAEAHSKLGKIFYKALKNDKKAAE